MTQVTSDDPTILTIFDATGDLMRRKIVPSLYYLYDQGYLAERTVVIGVSRRDWTDGEFREKVRALLLDSAAYHGCSDERLDGFLSMWRFCGGTFQDPDTYTKLCTLVQDVDAEWAVCSNKVYFMAVPPWSYETIFGHMAQRGLTNGCGGAEGWTRVMVEKPFGNDLASADELDAQLGQYFREEQIYRIDHYLAKEIVQGLLDFRFANTLFEPSWHHGSIERIEIDLLESIGVEQRGAFYDAVGALRDVGQNHCLEMLALLTMEQPVEQSAEAVRGARAELLRHLAPMTPEEVALCTYRAQYEGYRDIDGVAADSTTETYFRMVAHLEVPEWRGVPIVMQAGKRVGDPLKKMTVTLRRPSPCLCDPATHVANQVVFTMEPTDSIQISFSTKKPGLSTEVEQREFDFFLYEKREKAQYVEEYSRLIVDAIRGDQTLFVSHEEIEAAWRFIDPIEAAWAGGGPPLATYPPDTTAAAEASATVEAFAVPGGSSLRREIGVAGLGKMGAGLARNLMEHGWSVHVWNRTTSRALAMAAEGLVVSETLRDLVARLTPPRVVWLMVPAGKPVDAVLFGPADDGLGGLMEWLEPGDTVIDGGNSRWTDTRDRAKRFDGTGVAFLDSGTSGGPRGARNGACLMVGGTEPDFLRLRPLWTDISVPGGFMFFPGHGAGHFVKMVHNGVEYGMMQAIAEGFAIMREAPYEIDLGEAADIYDHGSVVESRLIGWLREAYEMYGGELEEIGGSVAQTGEGLWTVETAEQLGVPAIVIGDAVSFRAKSLEAPSYEGQVLSALRERFGGHHAKDEGSSE
jgi:glucose-6-phosphate 1-dehydrogenase